MSRINFLAILFGWFVFIVVFGQSVAAQGPGSPLSKEDREKQKELYDQRKNSFNNLLNEWLNGNFSPEPYKLTPSDDDEIRLKKQRINVALMVQSYLKDLRNAGIETFGVTLESQQRLAAAQLDFHTEPHVIVAILQQTLKAAKLVEAIVNDQIDLHSANIQQRCQSTYHRLDAEISLLRAKKKYGLPKDVLEENKTANLETRIDFVETIVSAASRKNKDELKNAFLPFQYVWEMRKTTDPKNMPNEEELKTLYDSGKDVAVNACLVAFENANPTQIEFEDKGMRNFSKDEQSELKKAVEAGLEISESGDVKVRIINKRKSYLFRVVRLNETWSFVSFTENITPRENRQPLSLSLLDEFESRNMKREPRVSLDDWLNGKHSPEPYKLKLRDDGEIRLKKQLINVALLEQEHFKPLEDAGVVRLGDDALESQQRLVAAQLDFHTEPQEIVAVLQQALESAKLTEAIVKDLFKEGDANIQQVSQSTYHRLDVEIKLLRAKKQHGLLENSAEKDNDDETCLKQQRIDAALMEQSHFKELRNAGAQTLDVPWESQQRLLAARLDFQTKPDEIVSSLQQALEAARQTEAIVIDQYVGGAGVNKAEVGQATYNRLESEIKLLRAKKKYGLFEDANKLPVP